MNQKNKKLWAWITFKLIYVCDVFIYVNKQFAMLAYGTELEFNMVLFAALISKVCIPCLNGIADFLQI